MAGQVYHGPFSAFLMNSNFFPDRFFLSAHTVSWMCVFSPKGAAAFVFDTFCPGGSKNLLTFSDNSGQDRICFRTARSHIRPVLSINAGASFPALNYWLAQARLFMWIVKFSTGPPFYIQSSWNCLFCSHNNSPTLLTGVCKTLYVSMLFQSHQPEMFTHVKDHSVLQSFCSRKNVSKYFPLPL